MRLKFGRIQPWTVELAALDQFKNLLLENYSKYFDDLLSGEQLLPFGLFVVFAYAKSRFAQDAAQILVQLMFQLFCSLVRGKSSFDV